MALHQSLYQCVKTCERIGRLYERCGPGLASLNTNKAADGIWQEALEGLYSARKLEVFFGIVKRDKALKTVHPAVDRILKGCDPGPYIEYLRQQTGLIELSRISDNKRGDVAIDELWIPSKVRLAGEEQPKPVEGKKRAAMLKSSTEVTSIEQAIHQHRLLLIRGEAGTGKSLLLKRIAWALVREKRETREKQLKLTFQGLPIWVQISALDKFIENQKAPVMKEDDPLWIPHFFQELAKQKRWEGLDSAFFAEQLQNPQAILLLDGLDEASSGHGRTASASCSRKLRRHSRAASS